MENTQIENASFKIRLKATLFDTIILLVLTPIVFYNVTKWKSVPILIVISLIGISYKILMEYKFGATFGKMIAKIRVTNYEYGKADIIEILQRNLFQIGLVSINLFLSFIVFKMQEFESVVSYRDYTLLLAKTGYSKLSTIFTIFIVLEACYMFYDKQKRTIHDIIGRTFVRNV